MKNNIKIGLEYALSMPVRAQHTVPALLPESARFADMPPVFATGYLVGFVEWACMEALSEYLTEEQRTVGTHINISHCAATPVGYIVTARVKLTAMTGRRFIFNVSVHDGDVRIAEGTHERTLINFVRFMDKMNTKQANVAERPHART